MNFELTDRHLSVVSVLRRVLALNLIVAFAKITLGYFSGAVSILSDGFHSLADASSNVVALVGVSAAQRPADENHPYGHRKYETMASVGILMFMPYGRIVPMHAIVLSGLVFAPTGIGIAIFIVLKTAAYVAMHVVEHAVLKTLRPPAAAAAADAAPLRAPPRS